MGERSPIEGSARMSSYAWKSVYALFAATLLTVILGAGFFVYGGIFALLSDVAPLLVAVFLAPVVWSLSLLNQGGGLNRVVRWIGVGAVILTAVGSIGLIGIYLAKLESVEFGFLGIQFVGWVLQGIWLIGIGAVGLRTQAIRRRTSWAGIVGGIGSAGGVLALTIAYAVGSGEVGTVTPVAVVAGGLYVVGFTLWALWLGGELRTLRTSS